MAAKVSQKQLMVNKANQRVIVVTSIAAFVVVFCAVASQAMFSQLMYQNKIIGAKKTALTQLEQNKSAVDELSEAYDNFVGSSTNIIKGNSQGAGPQDGDNAKIILDALPSKYDFPALATSLEKLMNAQKLEISNINGIDDEVTQSATVASGQPVPVAIPFQLTGEGNYQSIQNVTKSFEASIRPIQLQSMTLSGSNNKLSLSINGQTFYQPEKTFSVGTKVIN